MCKTELFCHIAMAPPRTISSRRRTLLSLSHTTACPAPGLAEHARELALRQGLALLEAAAVSGNRRGNGLVSGDLVRYRAWRARSLVRVVRMVRTWSGPLVRPCRRHQGPRAVLA